MVADVDVVGLQHVYRPGVLAADALVDLALRLDHAVNVGPPGQPLGGQCAPYQHFFRMDRKPPVLVLVAVPRLLDDGPRFLERHRLHALQDAVRHLGTAVGEALALPLGRVLDEQVFGEDPGLAPHRRCQQQSRSPNGEECVLHGVLTLFRTTACPAPAPCARRRRSSPLPGRRAPEG